MKGQHRRRALVVVKVAKRATRRATAVIDRVMAAIGHAAIVTVANAAAHAASASSHRAAGAARMHRVPRPCRVVLFVSCFVAALAAPAAAQDRAPDRREVVISAQAHRFTPDRIEVTQDDLVRVTLTNDDDRVYSFAVDAYRIIKRLAPRGKLVFEFRADLPGTFAFYCNLTSNPACRDMKGTLVVRPR